MGQLTNQYVSQSYQGLIKLEDSSHGVTATLQNVQDGLGNNLPIKISSTDVTITGSFYGNGQGLTGVTAIFDSSSLVTTSSFNAFTSSYYVDSGSFDSRIDGIIAGTGSYVTVPDFNVYTSSIDNTLNSLETATGSLQLQINSKLDTGSFNTYTSSNDAKVNALIAETGSLATTSSLTSLSSSIATTDLSQNNRLNSIETVTGSLQLQINQKLDSGSFNAYTSSNDTKVNALIAQTGSYVTETESGSFVTSVTGVTDTITITKGNGTTNSVTVNNVVNATSASFAQNAISSSHSVNSNTSVSSSQSQNSVSASQAQNAVTASFAMNVSPVDLSYYATTGSNNFVGQQNINGSVNVTGSLNVTGEITALSASITYLETVYQTSSIIFSSGSNILGDEASDTQTLNGTVNIPLGNLNVTGATTSSLGFYGNLYGTSSYATNALSASQSQNSVSSSYSINSDNSVSSSFAQNAISSSYSTNSGTAISSSFATNAISSSYATNATTASFALNAGTASFVNSAVTASIAYDLVVNGKCDNPGGLTKGTIVRITGAVGDNPLFNSASWTDDLNSANTLGMLTENVAYNGFANIITQGTVIGINTSGMTAGDLLFLSSSGKYTTSSVPAPYHEVRLGQVLRPQLNNGSAYISIDNGYELTELHDVDITTPAVGDVLTYISGSYGQWVNKNGSELGYANTGSNTFNGNQTITGSVTATQGFTGSLQGNASTATSASQAQNSVTASFAMNVSPVDLSSYATTGSNQFNGNQSISGSVKINTGGISLDVTGSVRVTQTIYNNDIQGLDNEKLYITNNNPVDSDIVLIPGQGANVKNVVIDAENTNKGLLVSGSVNVVNAVTASNFVGNGSGITGIVSSSYATNAGSADTSISSSQSTNSNTAISASQAENAVTSSHSLFAVTASFALNGGGGSINTGSFATTGSNTFNGNQIVSGSITVPQGYSINTNNIQSAYDSDTVIESANGRNIYLGPQGAGIVLIENNNANDGLTVSGSITAVNAVTASFFRGDGSAITNVVSSSFAQNAVSSSYSVTASYTPFAEAAVTASYALNANVNTSSLATTGSNVFRGTQYISGSADISGSLFVRGDSVGGLVGRSFNYLTSSLTSGGNMFFQDIVVASSVTQSLMVSSSANIVFNRPLANSTTFDSVIYGSGSAGGLQGSNIYSYPPEISVTNRGQNVPLTMQHNIGRSAQRPFQLTFPTGSITGSATVSTNYIGGILVYNGPQSSRMPTITGNNVIGTVQYNATVLQTSFSGSIAPQINNNYINAGSFSINARSGSFIFNNNNINGNASITNNFTVASSSHYINFVNNSITNNPSISFIGTSDVNQPRAFSGNIIGGQNVTIQNREELSRSGSLVNSLIVGQSLTVTASHQDGSTGNGSSTFLGKFNETGSNLSDSQQTIFALGTGTAAASRRTSLHVSSSGLLSVRDGMNLSGSVNLFNNSTTGTLNLTGSINLSGSLSVKTGGINVSGAQIQTNGEIQFNGGPYFPQSMENFVKLNATSTTTLAIDNFNLNTPASQSLWSSTVNTGSNYTEQLSQVTNGGTTGTLGLRNSGGVTTYTIGVNKTVVTGSIQGNVLPLTVSSNTASLNLDNGNFFELALTGSSNIRIEPSNIKPGQTVNIKLNTTGSGTVSFPTTVKQVSGSSYVPSTGTTTDIVTLVSFDSTNLFLANVKNLI